MDAPAGLVMGDLAELVEVEEEREVWRRIESTETEDMDVFVRWRGSLGIIVSRCTGYQRYLCVSERTAAGIGECTVRQGR